MDYLHEKDIIHRDIKLENLISKYDSNNIDLCITDFGLADFYKEDSAYLFKHCGTPGKISFLIIYY